MLETLVLSGLIADVALGVLAIELVLMLAFRRRFKARFGRAPSVASLVWNAGAGAGLLLALRAALTGGGAAAILAGLTAGLVFHLGEAAHRWRHPNA